MAHSHFYPRVLCVPGAAGIIVFRARVAPFALGGLKCYLYLAIGPLFWIPLQTPLCLALSQRPIFDALGIFPLPFLPPQTAKKVVLKLLVAHSPPPLPVVLEMWVGVALPAHGTFFQRVRCVHPVQGVRFYHP